VIAHFNPMYYAVEAAKLFDGGNYVNQTATIAIVVLLVLLGVASAWSSRTYRRLDV
jgi:hypothetical protein